MQALRSTNNLVNLVKNVFVRTFTLQMRIIERYNVRKYYTWSPQFAMGLFY